MLKLSGIPHVCPCLAQLSPECRDLLSRIFHIKEADRITIQQIMQHPWCVSGASVFLSRLRRTVRCFGKAAGSWAARTAARFGPGVTLGIMLAHVVSVAAAKELSSRLPPRTGTQRRSVSGWPRRTRACWRSSRALTRGYPPPSWTR